MTVTELVRMGGQATARKLIPKQAYQFSSKILQVAIRGPRQQVSDLEPRRASHLC
jgi:hypothetical protein